MIKKPFQTSDSQSDVTAFDTRNQDLRELLRKSSVSLALKVAGGLSAFMMTLIVGRSLGTTGAGLFFLSLAIVTVTAAICRLGLDQAITRFVAEARENQDWDSINGIYVRAIPSVLLTSLFAAVCLYFSGPSICKSIFNEPQLVPVFRWMSLSIVGLAVAWIHSHFFQGLEEIKAFQVFQNFGVSVAFMLVLAFVMLFASGNVLTSEALGLCFLIGSSSVATLAHLVWMRKHKWFSWSGSDCGWQRIRTALAPFFGMLILQQLSTWLPQISLGIFRPADEVGIYNAAFRLANLTSLILLGVNSVVFPKFAALYSAGELERLKAIAQSSAGLMAIGCLPFLAALLFFPGPVLSLFGEGFAEGATVLQIIAIGQLVNVLTGSVGGLLNMTGNQDVSLRSSLGSFFAMLLILLSLTPAFGAIGTAAAQAIGVIVNMVLLSFACRNRLGFAPIGGLSRLRHVLKKMVLRGI